MESATRTAVRDTYTDQELVSLASQVVDNHGPWSHLEMLVALLIDQLMMLRHDVARALGSKDRPPKPLPRPGVPDLSRRVRKPDPRGVAYLQARREEHARGRAAWERRTTGG